MADNGSTIMILPGDPSKKAKIDERTFVSTLNIAGTILTAQVDAAPTSGVEQFGVDVTRWQSVEVFHFSDEADHNWVGSKVTVTPWYWYAPTSFYVPYAGSAHPVPAHGNWVAGKDVTLAIDGTFDAMSQFATYATNNADRIFFQVKSYTNGVPAVAPPVGAVVWYKQAIFGLVPRPSDGASVMMAVPDAADAGGAAPAGGGGGIGTGALAVYNSSAAAGAIALTTAELGPFELVAVTIHFDIAPVTAGNLTVTLNANDGALYDAVLLTLDPSTYLGGVTSIAWKPEARFFFETGDQIVVDYANADNRDYGARIVITR
jgi:hypothetical protein